MCTSKNDPCSEEMLSIAVFSSVALKKQCAEFSRQCAQCGVHLKCSAAQFVFISFAAEQVRVLIGGEGKGSEEEGVRRCSSLYTSTFSTFNNDLNKFPF